ncbi:response regulator [Candidatus Leptofilum sp.]|uniref:response regulator n=1 Tax=Candidatus Leptofilum sp. TaxID=3241576 RepID=UPI003B5ACBE4
MMNNVGSAIQTLPENSIIPSEQDMQPANENSDRIATILIVEDDQSMLDGMNDLLEIADLGYDIDILQANDGRMALDVMANHEPDLIISDVMMPQMGGYEFLNHVRANPDWIQIPFIFVTAKGEEPDIRKGRLSDADLYITKPFVITELLSLIHAQLDNAYERKEARQRNIDSLKKNILQILNHEFRTPLTYVTAYYEMLADSLKEFTDGRNYREYLRGIQAGCLRLTRLVDDFICVMELRSGEAQTRYLAEAKPLSNVADLLQEVVAAFQDTSDEARFQIKSNIPDKLPLVWGVASSIKNILERLLSNATKFTDPNATDINQITVTVSAQDKSIQIEVVDQGMGFPAHMSSQIFEPFVQYNRGILEQQGAGTGLAIVQGLVQLHNGRIEAESQEGKGSKFKVILPVYQRKKHATASGSTAKDGTLTATVLVVEDDLNLLNGLEDLLTIFEGKYKLNVLTALNGVAALNEIKKQIPDLIISDIMMPQMGGYELLTNVRENPQWLHIPFIFLTAKGEKRDEYEGFRRGVDEYITKPYDSDDVLRFVEKQLDKHFHNQSLVAQSFDDLKRSIINLISPDFRTPLASVTEHSDELSRALQDANTDRDLKHSLHGIQDNSLRLTNLIEDFITLAELKTGEAWTAHSLKAYPLPNLGGLLFETVQSFKHRPEAAGWHVDMTTLTEMPKVEADWSTLQEAIERLMQISLQYAKSSQRKDELIASLYNGKSSNVKIIITVSASLDAEIMAQFREILTNEEPDLLKNPEIGPSLYIAKGYVGLHRGQLSFSEGKDGNFHFAIKLPAYEE